MPPLLSVYLSGLRAFLPRRLAAPAALAKNAPSRSYVVCALDPVAFPATGAGSGNGATGITIQATA